MTGHGSHANATLWTTGEIVETLGWTLAGTGDATVEVGEAFIDSRRIGETEDALFVAVAGADSHGAEHWFSAIEAGAAVIIVGSDADPFDVEEMSSQDVVPVIVADVDSWTMLGQLGRAWRRRNKFTVVGITGSAGKTSTKDLLAALLAPVCATVASVANQNNELGVPLTLLSAPSTTDVVICEMGMRGSGQIAYLCDIAEPDVSILTNAGSAHLELLGSLEAIARAKAEIIAGTAANGVAVVPADQPELVTYAAQTPARVVRFADDAGDDADVRVCDVVRTDRGLEGQIEAGEASDRFSIPVHGLLNARNFAAAVAAALAAVPGAELSTFNLTPHSIQLSNGRGQRTPLEEGGILIDDAYNANPESMRAAIAELCALSEKYQVRAAVIGHMAELGPDEVNMHRDLGRHIASSGIEKLIAIGDRPSMFALVRAFDVTSGPVQDSEHFDNLDQAMKALDHQFQGDELILVKASNSAGLGRYVAGIVERYGSIDWKRATRPEAPA